MPARVSLRTEARAHGAALFRWLKVALGRERRYGAGEDPLRARGRTGEGEAWARGGEAPGTSAL